MGSGTIWINHPSGAGLGGLNLGEGTNDVFNSTGNVTLNGAGYEYKPMVLQYENFTLNYGHTMTVDRPIAGLVILCRNTITINGTMDFTGCGQYINIERKIIEDAMPLMFGALRYPVPINGNGGDGGGGAKGGKGLGGAAQPPYSSGGTGGRAENRGTGGLFLEEAGLGVTGASALGGGGAGGAYNGTSVNSQSIGGGGGGNRADANGRTGGAPCTVATKAAGLNILVAAVNIVLQGSLVSAGLSGGKGGNESSTVGGSAAGGGGGGGNGGGGVTLIYRNLLQKNNNIVLGGGLGGVAGTGKIASPGNGQSGTAGVLQVLQL